MAKDVIIACDFPNKKETMDFLSVFGDKRPFVKIGMELFYAEGPDVVRELKSRGHKVFLDVKVHDIPNTVRRTMQVLSGLGADICDVHAAGTCAMMRAAAEGFYSVWNSMEEETSHCGSQLGKSRTGRPLLVGVTQLTSTDQTSMEEDLLIREPIENVVMHYALNAKKSGLSGVVCSPLEAAEVHEVCGADFVTVTPGIRFDESEKGDQKRVMTPAAAREAGSDYIVVGRPITKADDPLAAYERCVRVFLGR